MRDKPILTPFRHIAGHIVNAQFIRELASCRMSGIHELPTKPADLIPVIAEAVNPVELFVQLRDNQSRASKGAAIYFSYCNLQWDARKYPITQI